MKKSNLVVGVVAVFVAGIAGAYGWGEYTKKKEIEKIEHLAQCETDYFNINMYAAAMSELKDDEKSKVFDGMDKLVAKGEMKPIVGTVIKEMFAYRSNWANLEPEKMGPIIKKFSDQLCATL